MKKDNSSINVKLEYPIPLARAPMRVETLCASTADAAKRTNTIILCMLSDLTVSLPVK